MNQDISTATDTSGETPTASDKIICHIDNVKVHTIQAHIKNNHSDWTIERYKSEFPDAPLFSDYALMVLEKKRKQKDDTVAVTNMATPKTNIVANLSMSKETLSDTFDLGSAPAALNAQGQPIAIDVMSGHTGEAVDYLPDIDTGYDFNIDLLKKAIIGLQLNIPMYFWGFHGTGKTSVLQQVSARTKRPFIRVQHTLNMQESDVLGQWTVRNGATEFQLGPLPTAMINGWVYCADEYDTAMPNVTTVYQPVLEGQALLIKEAPAHLRKIIPHPNFRFCATGNTNGGGDETGLYQGTLMQNAANYSRFGITEEVKYMEPTIEANILQSRARLHKPDAVKLVKFGNRIRESFADGKIGMTVSTRELISAAKLSIALGGKWAEGINLAFANRLSRVDRQVVEEILQRQFGSV